MTGIEVADASIRFRRGGGLSDLSFSAMPGECVALFGSSGSGKTTLLRLLSGSLTPDSGAVSVFGCPPREVRRRIGAAILPLQFPPRLTPHQAVTRAVRRRSVTMAQRPARIAEALELLDLYGLRDRPLRELSTGEQAAAALAIAIAPRPPVLVLDNLLTQLPESISYRFLDYLASRAGDGCTVIHATTRSSAAERADRVALLDSGCLIVCDSPAALLHKYAADSLIIESSDPESIQRTLRGIFDLEIEETPEGIRFTAADGIATAAHLFRHPPEGLRAVYVRRPSLWDVLARLREQGQGARG